MTKGTTQKCVTLLGRRRVSGKVNVSGQMFIKFLSPNFLNKEPCYGELLRPFISVLYRSQNGAGLARSVSRLSYELDDPGFEIR